MRIGIVGAGMIGSTLAKLWVDAGHEVRLASRHPEELSELVQRLGSGASAGTPEDAASFGEVVMLTVPLKAVPGLAHGLAVPLSGWLYDSASGLRPFRWFGWALVPKLAAPDEALAAVAKEAHEWLFWTLATIVVVHTAAALYHHAFRNDPTLARMLPGKRRSPP